MSFRGIRKPSRQTYFSRIVASLMEYYGARGLGKKTRISAATISRVARGETPSVTTFLRICQRFNLKPMGFYRSLACGIKAPTQEAQ